MNSRRKQRMLRVVLVLMGVGLTSLLVLYALRANIDLFYTPGEIVQGKGEKQEKPQIGQRLRIGGMVLPGSVDRDQHSLKVSFELYDAIDSVTVHYEGILPDLFREGQGVVAQGILVSANEIQATEVLAKHDENYTPPEVKAALEKNHSLPADAYQSPEKAEVTSQRTKI